MYSMYTVLVPTSQRTQYVSIIRTNRFVLCIVIIAAYCGNCMDHVKALYGGIQSILVLWQLVRIVTTGLSTVNPVKYVYATGKASSSHLMSTVVVF